MRESFKEFLTDFAGIGHLHEKNCKEEFFIRKLLTYLLLHAESKPSILKKQTSY